MLQAKEIQQRLNSVELAIGQASQALSAEPNIPGELRDCIQRLDKQSDLVQEVIQSRDAMRIRKMVDDMEDLGDRAKKVCSSSANLTPQIKNAVMRVHDELSDLKHQLH